MVAFMCWLRVGAQVQPVSPAPQLPARVIRQKVPRWLRKIQLSANETIYFQPRKEAEPLTGRPILKLNAAVNKSALTEKSDSILTASQEFSMQIAKRRRLNRKAPELLLSTLYSDRACVNAGLSRRITYVIKGRTCTMQTDSSFDDSSVLDSAIASRMRSFFFAANSIFIL